MGAASTSEGAPREPDALMEQVVARENMWAALRRVEQNKGAPGVNGMRVQDLREEHLKANCPCAGWKYRNPGVASGFWASRRWPTAWRRWS